jgi:uncharacterized NAD-dependent epimerase/dehydratase family protein
MPTQSPSVDPVRRVPSPETAVVYCEGNFAQPDGKTANGLVRHSERYRIVGVIDSEHRGLDAGRVLDDVDNGIAIFSDLAEAADAVNPDALIFGTAPTSGMLSTSERTVMLDAMSRGMDIVNGLHEFLTEDPEFVAAAAQHQVSITDIRKPRAKKDLHMFTGRIKDVTCPRIAVLGTDSAIGKRTTATILTKALNEAGIRAVLVSTGQTGLIQGGRYGVALDAIPCQFCSGEIENAVVEAFTNEHPDVIIIEGQGALSHPAYLSSTFILRGSQPNGVILQHAPGRKRLGDFSDTAMPTPASEINLLQTFAETRVIGLTINHENLTDAEVSTAMIAYETELGIPATDALTRPTDLLVEMVTQAFPSLLERAVATAE